MSEDIPDFPPLTLDQVKMHVDMSHQILMNAIDVLEIRIDALENAKKEGV